MTLPTRSVGPLARRNSGYVPTSQAAAFGSQASLIPRGRLPRGTGRLPVPSFRSAESTPVFGSNRCQNYGVTSVEPPIHFAGARTACPRVRNLCEGIARTWLSALRGDTVAMRGYRPWDSPRAGGYDPSTAQRCRSSSSTSAGLATVCAISSWKS